MLGIEPAKVIAWIKRGELRAVNVADNPNGKRPRYRITQDALDHFTRARETKPAPVKPAPVARKAKGDHRQKYYL